MIVRKIMLLGEIGVGKTSIARRLVLNRFGEGNYLGTVGVDVLQYEVVPPPGDERFVFNVFDTDGRFGASLFRSVYIKGADAAIVLGDVQRRNTLDQMVRLAEQFADALPGRFLHCAINKVDLLEDGETPVLPERLTAIGLPYTLTSAKTGENVKATFHEAAATIVGRTRGV